MLPVLCQNRKHKVCKISVIIPVYGVEKFCIDYRIYYQPDLRELKNIIDNNESLYNCPKICDEWVTHYARILCSSRKT